MSDTVTLTESIASFLAPDIQSLQMARTLVRDGAFKEPRSSPDGRWLCARCHGSAQEPYQVAAEIGDDIHLRCTCPSYKHPCKHALGLVLLAAWHRDRFRVDPALNALGGLSVTPLPLEQPTIGPAAPTNDGEALWQAIFQEPDELAHRLVYADWLDDQGQGDLAQFIRVQCELLVDPPEPRLSVLTHQETKLLEANRKNWLADVPKHLRGKVVFRGGFIAHLDVTAQTLLKYGPELFERFPIDSVRLECSDSGDLRQLAVKPFLSRLRRLALWGSNHSALKELLPSPFLTNVRRLTAVACASRMIGAAALVAWPGLVNLEFLDLVSCHLGDMGVEKICDVGPRGLRCLRLADNRISNSGAVAIASRSTFATLQELDLTTNQIGLGGVRALANAPHLAGLKRLELSLNSLTDSAALVLAGSDHLANLERLWLRRIGFSEKARQALRDRFGERVLLD